MAKSNSLVSDEKSKSSITCSVGRFNVNDLSSTMAAGRADEIGVVIDTAVVSHIQEVDEVHPGA